jgi:catechol 2,3-dioxygenase-like lactoylglutathione lyase family enzyme
VSEPEFDQIFARVQAASIPYRSEPFSPEDMKVYYRGGGPGFYFRDPSGHLLELLTAEL